MNFADFINAAIQQEGSQENLAMALDMSPSELSKRSNGRTGWGEAEINRLLTRTGHEIVSREEASEKIRALTMAMRIVLNEEPKREGA